MQWINLILPIVRKTLSANDNNTILGISLLSNGNVLELAIAWLMYMFIKS